MSKENEETLFPGREIHSPNDFSASPGGTHAAASGMTLVSPSEWSDIAVGIGYSVTFRMLGNRILLTTPCGDLSTPDMDEYFRLRGEFLNRFSSPGDRIVEIRDYARVSGVPTRKGRVDHARHLLENAHRLAGFVLLNPSPMVFLVFKVGKLVAGEPYPIVSVASFEEAVRTSVDLLLRDDASRLASASNFETRPEWAMELDGLGFRYSVISPFLLHAKGWGYLEEKHVEPLLSVMKKIISDGFVKGPDYFKVVDYSEITGGSWKARQLYAAGLKKVDAETGARPVQNYIIGASGLIRTSLKMMRPFFSFELRFVDDLSEAIELIRRGAENREVHRPLGSFFSAVGSCLGTAASRLRDLFRPSARITPEHISQVVEYIATISWGQSFGTADKVDSDHPLNELYEALAVLYNDIMGHEEERNRVMENLEELIKTRTAALEEINERLHQEIRERLQIEFALRKNKEIAEKANAAKDDFMARLSHELRTPLNGIMGFADLLKNVSNREEVPRYSDLILRESSRLLNLINQLLDVAKIEKGVLEVENRSTNLSELLDRVVVISAQSARKKGLSLSCEIGPDVPGYADFDPARLEQILLNLLDNAIKFTSSGEIRISVGLNEDKDALEFRVSDTGIGIPSEDRARVFEAFDQGSRRISSEYGGTGLGMSISRDLVRLMGGRMELDGGCSEGTTVLFDLPVRKSEEKAGKAGRVGRGGSTLAGRKPEGRSAPESDDSLVFTVIGRVGEASRSAGGGSEHASHRGPAPEGGTAAEPGKNDPEFMGSGSKAVSAGPLRPTDSEVNESSLESKRILIVEDYDVNRELLNVYLMGTGTVADEAENGRDAVQMAGGKKYDCIIMDLQMPGMDGLEAARIIRKGPGPNFSTPILGFTAFCHEKDRQACIDSGMDGIIFKPVVRDDFLASLSAWTNRDSEVVSARFFGSNPESAVKGESPVAVKDESPGEVGAGETSAGHAEAGFDSSGETTDHGKARAGLDGSAPGSAKIEFGRGIHEFGNDRSLYAQVLMSFSDTLKNIDVPGLQAGLGKRDFSAMKSICHRVRGAALNLCAVALGEAAERVERLALGEVQTPGTVKNSEIALVAEAFMEEVRAFLEAAESFAGNDSLSSGG